jgi:hypothetical protein
VPRGVLRLHFHLGCHLLSFNKADQIAGHVVTKGRRGWKSAKGTSRAGVPIKKAPTGSMTICQLLGLRFGGCFRLGGDTQTRCGSSRCHQARFPHFQLEFVLTKRRDLRETC